jgi:hypothetical protein
MNSKEDVVLARSRAKLKREVEVNVLRGAEEILNIVEVALGDPARYRIVRSKVLRSANDAVRDIKKTIDINYQVLFVPTNEDVIKVQQPSVVTDREL